MKCAGAILAGGRSERLGRRPKALIPLPEGQPLIARVARVVSEVASPVVVSANDPARFAFLGLDVVRDERPGEGPLGALASVLAAVATPRVLVVACDLPCLSAPVLRHLVALSETAPFPHAVFPRSGGHLHGLCAVYTKECLAPIRDALARGRRDVRWLADGVPSRFVEEEELAALDPGLGCFENVNTLEDVARVLGPAVGQAVAARLRPDTP